MALIKSCLASSGINSVEDLHFTPTAGYLEMSGINVGDFIMVALNAPTSYISSVVGLTQISSDQDAQDAACVILYRATATTVRVTASDTSLRLFMWKVS